VDRSCAICHDGTWSFHFLDSSDIFIMTIKIFILIIDGREIGDCPTYQSTTHTSLIIVFHPAFHIIRFLDRFSLKFYSYCIILVIIGVHCPVKLPFLCKVKYLQFSGLCLKFFYQGRKIKTEFLKCEVPVKVPVPAKVPVLKTPFISGPNFCPYPPN